MLGWMKIHWKNFLPLRVDRKLAVQVGLAHMKPAPELQRLICKKPLQVFY